MFLAGDAQSPRRHRLPRAGERIRSTPTSPMKLKALYGTGGLHLFVDEVGQRDHIVHARPVAQGAHLDLNLRGRLEEGAVDLVGPLDDPVRKLLGSIHLGLRCPTLHDLLRGESSRPVRRASEDVAQEERRRERERQDRGEEEHRPLGREREQDYGRGLGRQYKR